MLFLVGIICGLICVVGLSQGMQKWDKGCRTVCNKKKKDLSEQELIFITRILSIGLVDADPDILHHIKEYRDLHGGST